MPQHISANSTTSESSSKTMDELTKGLTAPSMNQPGHSPANLHSPAVASTLLGQIRLWLEEKSHQLWNRRLSSDTTIWLHIGWPLWLLPIALINQILAPHPVWIVLFITLIGLYTIGYFWLRNQQAGLSFTRQQDGVIMAAGDQIEERFELINESPLPILWAEFVDRSDIPRYNQSRIIACGSVSSYRWQSTLVCNQRGLYRLGPSVIRWSDPFGLFSVQKRFEESVQIIIYPRVAHLPKHQLPHGTIGGAKQQPHPLIGSIRSSSVREYQPGDSLRHVHWPSTARHRHMMVTELDSEYGGEVWIVLDLNEAVQEGEDDESTVEYGIVVAASLAAQLISSSERLAVGLLFSTNSPSSNDWHNLSPESSRTGLNGQEQLLRATASESVLFNESALFDGREEQLNGLSNSAHPTSQVKVLAPQAGQAQFWRMMGALATARPSQISLAELLRNNQSLIGRRQSVIVITPQISSEQDGHRGDGIAANLPNLDAQASRISSEGASGVNTKVDSRENRASDEEIDQGYTSVSDIAKANASEVDDSNWVSEMIRNQSHRRGTVLLLRYGSTTNLESDADNLSDGDNIEEGVEASSSRAERQAIEKIADTPINHDEKAIEFRTFLMHNRIDCRVMHTSERLPSLLTERRTRKEIRNTPSGGAIVVDVEEEIR